jgi:hypothetical protein
MVLMACRAIISRRSAPLFWPRGSWDISWKKQLENMSNPSQSIEIQGIVH